MRDMDRYVKEYEKNNFEVNIQVKYRRKHVINMIEKAFPDSILEIGCGMDPVFKHLSMKNISKYTIVEPSTEFYARARQSIESMGLTRKIDVILGTFETECNELKPEYDMIICSGLLHEVEEPQEMLRCIRGICNKHTVVHINVPNAYSLHRLWAYESGLISDIHDLSDSNRLFQQSSVFDLKSLCLLIKSCGFRVVDKGSFFCKLFAHNQMQKMIEAEIITNQMLDGMDRLVKYMPEYGSEIYINAKICDRE